ncbi:MAG: protease inhibitor I42 family protein, partial [Sedimentisphaerales bacterium]|nr:protease inhibitor I42 family protein [Sedimentisphaerales bacterium]
WNTYDDFWVDGDYHLKSETGRWNPDTQTWVTDDVTSPCIDAGDPNSQVGDEPFPNGIRINMGAYGGTTEASKSFSDIPEVVNVNDSDNGSQVTLKQGQLLAVTLESNPTTGYSWEPVEKKNSILEQFGDSLYFPSEQDDETVGAGGWEIFYFKSISIGKETLELIYRRPWETDVEPAKTFSIEVTVN